MMRRYKYQSEGVKKAVPWIIVASAGAVVLIIVLAFTVPAMSQPSTNPLSPQYSGTIYNFETDAYKQAIGSGPQYPNVIQKFGSKVLALNGSTGYNFKIPSPTGNLTGKTFGWTLYPGEVSQTFSMVFGYLSPYYSGVYVATSGSIGGHLNIAHVTPTGTGTPSPMYENKTMCLLDRKLVMLFTIVTNTSVSLTINGHKTVNPYNNYGYTWNVQDMGKTNMLRLSLNGGNTQDILVFYIDDINFSWK